MQQEAATADARGVRLDDAQYHLDGDRRIDGGAAATQDFEPGLDGQRMGRCDHRLRRRQHGLRASGREQQQRDTQQAADLHARRATMKRRRKGNRVMPSARVG